jgi:hypothetical protein
VFVAKDASPSGKLGWRYHHFQRKVIATWRNDFAAQRQPDNVDYLFSCGLQPKPTTVNQKEQCADPCAHLSKL